MELGLWIHRIPEKTISGNDYFYIGTSNDYEYLLVVENGELRIYSYDYWSEDNIQDNHSGEDWWGWLHDCFEGMYDCFAVDTMRYQTLNIEGKAPFGIAEEIINWADSNMADDLNWALVENNDRRYKAPSLGLLNFINGALSKIGEKTYCYYK